LPISSIICLTELCNLVMLAAFTIQGHAQSNYIAGCRDDQLGADCESTTRYVHRKRDPPSQNSL